MCTVKITCRECGKKFDITEREIEFYKNKGFQPPKRCKICRQAREDNDLGTNKLGLKQSSFGDYLKVFGMPEDVKKEHPSDGLRF